MSMFIDTGGLPAEPATAAAPRESIVLTAPRYETIKAVLEFVLALSLLILSAPLIFVAMILVKLTSRGPAIYSQTRIGKDGQPFTIYKLRSMTHECESLTGAQWCKPGDARVTTVGRWLRKTHIDELPQLWNVLRGDMSLIGPRPERPEFTPALEQAIPLYRQRVSVRPGLTGFAQVQLPPDSDLDSVRIKLAYDLYYVSQMSIWFDIVVYAGTLAKLLGFSQLAIRHLCGFPGRDTVDAVYRRLATLRC
jgi:lipopolysaccharide/colanic/teichoic acid biosynthesis glycosyltransferase